MLAHLFIDTGATSFFYYPHFGSVATTFDLKSHRGSTIATQQSLSIFQIPLDITEANDSEQYRP